MNTFECKVYGANFMKPPRALSSSDVFSLPNISCSISHTMPCQRYISRFFLQKLSASYQSSYLSSLAFLGFQYQMQFLSVHLFPDSHIKCLENTKVSNQMERVFLEPLSELFSLSNECHHNDLSLSTRKSSTESGGFIHSRAQKAPMILEPRLDSLNNNYVNLAFEWFAPTRS